MGWDFSDRTLTNGIVQLEPLRKELLTDICDSLIPDLTGWYSVIFGLNTVESYQKEIQDAENFRKSRSGLGFAIRDLKTGEIAGISFFLKMDEENRHLEIGTTNIAPRFRRTHINTATKLLMLTEAFERLNCIRVSFRVDTENAQSRTAIERIGAKFGGTLRHERILPDGRIRDYLFYSILDSEWPDVKERLRNHAR